MQKLQRPFYARPALLVAPDLLGKVLVRSLPAGCLAGRIVETEAYGGEDDPGSHAFRGRAPRNAAMFGPPGHLYVYLSYGVHHCLNVVTDGPDEPGAVLIRALEPLEGIEIMTRLRGGRPLIDVANGPGKLCEALQITRAENGVDLAGNQIWIQEDGYDVPDVATSTRVGLSAGRDLPHRFYIPGNPYISRGRPSSQ